MDLIVKDSTTEEKVDATLKATEVMIEYMGTTRECQLKIDKGLTFLRWMMTTGLIMVILFIGSEIYRTIFPPSTEVDRRWINQQQRSIAEQQESITLQKKTSYCRDC